MAADIFDSDPRLLASMLELEPSSARVWRAEELSAILSHQMQAEISTDLSALASRSASRRAELERAAADASLATFGGVLRSAQPSLGVLELIKDFAKTHRNQPNSVLPAEIANILYFGAIAAAQLRHGKRITRIDNDAMEKGIRWCAAQPWLDESMRALFAEAEAALPG